VSIPIAYLIHPAAPADVKPIPLARLRPPGSRPTVRPLRTSGWTALQSCLADNILAPPLIGAIAGGLDVLEEHPVWNAQGPLHRHALEFLLTARFAVSLAKATDAAWIEAVDIRKTLAVMARLSADEAVGTARAALLDAEIGLCDSLADARLCLNQIVVIRCPPAIYVRAASLSSKVSSILLLFFLFQK
jgi:hypothetical protein